MSRLAVAALGAAILLAACTRDAVPRPCGDASCSGGCGELGAACAAPADCCSGACDGTGHCEAPPALPALVAAAAPSLARADGASFANVWVIGGTPPVTLTTTRGTFAGGGQSIVLANVPGVARLVPCDASVSATCAGPAEVTATSAANAPATVSVLLLAVERCDDGVDDDGDGATDCADVDCAAVGCDTGQPGLCGLGRSACGGTGSCEPIAGPASEACNGADDDCDGEVDEGACVACYEGPSGTEGVGACRGGTRVWGLPPYETPESAPCVGQVLPAVELCNGLDDDCDGTVDGLPSRTCYEGAAATVDGLTGLPMGVCARGTQPCAGGEWGACTGQVLPAAEVCGTDGTGDGVDDDCDGLADDTCGCPAEGMARPCYGGPGGTAGVGACGAGVQVCVAGAWSECAGAKVPTAEVCGNGLDDDCDGDADEPVHCPACPSSPVACYEASPGTLDIGACRAGVRECRDGSLGACAGQVLPSVELCNGRDDDCDGEVDDGPPACPGADTCVSGNCVPAACDPERPCPVGFTCEAGRCAAAPCGSGAPCAAGTRCAGDACVDPCDGVACGAGATCASGLCTGGSCYVDGCGGGLLCRRGYCVADPCSGITCAVGTHCREGLCIPSCAYVACAAGQRCGLDGACEVDPCAGVTCSPGATCLAGTCVTDPCASLGCGAGMVCDGGACVDDPCAGVLCPVGACAGGQCY
jgi:hypothetical protein